MQAVAARIPGLLLALAIALAADWLHAAPLPPFSIERAGKLVHPLGPDVLAILLGLLIGNLAPLPFAASPGCRWIMHTLLPTAIVLLGATLDLSLVAKLGIPVLAMLIPAVALAVAAAAWLGPRVGLAREASLLIGAGTGICGSSAVISAGPVVGARQEDTAIALATVNFCGFCTMLAAPLLGAACGLSPAAFGIWSGASIHAVPQVLAAAAAYSPDATTLAAMVKLARVSMLAPLVLTLAALQRRHAPSQAGHLAPGWRGLVGAVPWFVWGFVAAAALHSLHWIPTTRVAWLGYETSAPELIKAVARFLTTISMAALGLEVSFRQLLAVGGRALAAGAAATLAILLFTLGMVCWLAPA